MIDASDKPVTKKQGEKKSLVKRGRKPLFSDSMTPAQRKARQRREQDAFIIDNDSDTWTESDCMRVLSTKKFSSMNRFAWERLGQIKGYL